MNCPIPSCTHPLSMGWTQPDALEMLFDDTHVLMSSKALAKLQKYDCTMPSGVYEGKMWQRREADYVGGRHLLVWYGPSELAGQCGIYFREILVVEASK